MPGWTQEELDILRDEKLVINPYTRFFTLARTKEILKLEFDENEHPKSRLPSEIFNAFMQCIARAFLLPCPDNNGKPWANTRTPVDEIFNKCKELTKYRLDLDSDQDQQNKHLPENVIRNIGKQKNENNNGDKSKEKENAGQQKMPKPARFFENLTCTINDQRLIQLTIEIKMINHIRMSIAASMLERALLESSLRYQLIKVGKWNDLVEKTVSIQDWIK